MKPSTIKILAISTVLVAGGAWFATTMRDRETAAAESGSAALPALVAKINDVGQVIIESKDGTVTVDRKDDGWGLAEKSGYPVKGESVVDLLMALHGAEVVEEKTANKAKFERLGLQEPDVEGSMSKRVVIKSKAGEEIASVLVGDRRMPKTAGAAPSDQYYVHPKGDGPALLVKAKLNIEGRQISWIEPRFLDIKRDRMKAMRITHPDGEVVEVQREAMDSMEPTIMTPIPEGKQPRVPAATRGFLDVVMSLRFDDVQNAEDVDFPEGEVVTAEFFTENGLRITATTIERPKEGQDGVNEVLARFSFDVAQDEALIAKPADMTPALPPAETPAEGTEGEGAEGESTEGEAPPEIPAEPEEPEGPTLAELQAEADELNAKTEGWAFTLPGWKTAAYRMRLEGLIQDIPEPEPAPEGIPGVDPPNEGAVVPIKDDGK